MPRSIDDVLAEARAKLARVDPDAASRAVAGGALLVDIRPEAQRRTHGEVPGALVIERNVLEWRLDPACDHRIPEATGYDRPVVILCQQGYTSSLAAASLVDMGLTATDVEGGYEAWKAAGLPTTGGG